MSDDTEQPGLTRDELKRVIEIAKKWIGIGIDNTMWREDGRTDVAFIESVKEKMG